MSNRAKRINELLNEKQYWKQRDNKAKALKTQRALDDCTFKPKVKEYKPRKRVITVSTNLY